MKEIESNSLRGKNHLNRFLWNSSEELRKLLMRQLYQTWVSYGLRRDLNETHINPQARINISVRELHDGDIPHLLPQAEIGLSRQDRLDIANRLAHLAEHIPTCYVAVDNERGTPCFMQWLMTHSANDTIQRFFRGRFPVLARDEALLENAYTPQRYRGLGIMPAAMSRIAERAVEHGCRYVTTFALQENKASLKGCAKAGFAIFMTRRDSHTLFHLIRRRRFESPTDVALSEC